MGRYEGDIEKLGAPSGTKLGAWNRQEVGDFITHIILYIEKGSKNETKSDLITIPITIALRGFFL